MKALSTAALMLVAVPATVRAEVMFVGDGIFTAASSACGAAAAVGDFGRFTYRAAYSSLNNGADSYLAFVPTRSSYTMTVPNNTFRAGINYAGQSVGSTLNIATKTGAITGWSQSPATLDPSTRKAIVTMTFTNFWAITNCTVSLRTILLRVKSFPGDVVN